MIHWFSGIIEPLVSSPVEDLIEFLCIKGILKRYVKCGTCLLDMKTKPYTRNSDSVAFKCCNRNCNDFSKYVSICTKSLLSGFTVPLRDFLLVAYKWFNNHTHEQIGTEVNIKNKSIIKIIDLLRNQCFKYKTKNPIRLGGDGMIVQIDESLFRHKQKYHRGRQPTREIWVFRLDDCSFIPAKISLYVVPNRTANTLLPIIERVCASGTIIHSDQWKAYLGISSKLRLAHFTVNHSEGFVNHNNGVHTQNIESI
ncbi:hypothetical protein HERIO_2023 [Hepatospora eriocheir]|uniref:ISXO2-like transposase domain-containing protein n=1 Tax=Hepatospora eriocheir TaxID=1081669 RepID=A0A1X0Q886_9MICR|nr:hypothetical protein HERIO_2023 [Hepatospora eriocheir]